MIRISNKNGQFLMNVIVLPLLILLAGYGITVFVQSTHNTRHFRRIYTRNQTEMTAMSGVEYVFAEIAARQYTSNPFLTHKIAAGTDTLAPHDDPPATADLYVPDAQINKNEDYVYQVRDEETGSIFQAKVYMEDGAYYALVKSTSFAETNREGQTRLFVGIIKGTPLFDYLAFYSNDADFGWKKINAGQAKIHANGKIKFNDFVEIENVSEISTAGKFEWEMTPFVHPDDKNKYQTRRWPHVNPNDLTYSGGEVVPVGLNQGNYVNSMDGHYPGMRRGLFRMSTNGIIPWKGETITQDIKQPVWPFYWDTNFTAPVPEDTSPYIWDPAWGDQNMWYEGSWINNKPEWHNTLVNSYWEQDLSCYETNTCAWQDPYGNNNANYYEANVKINGYFIPSILPDSSPYDKEVYYGRNLTAPVRLTDSVDQESDWDNYVSHFPIEIDQGDDPDNPLDDTITGLAAVVEDQINVLKDSTDGVEEITVPQIHLDTLKTINSSSDSSSHSAGQIQMTIEQEIEESALKEYIINVGNNSIKLNDTTSWMKNERCCADLNCSEDINDTLFEKKEFINPKSGLPENTIRMNIEHLNRCHQFGVVNPPEGGQPNFLPSSGIIIAADSPQVTDKPIGVALYNARQLPQGGLTVIANNAILEGHVNYVHEADAGYADWTKQSAAIIASNRISLVSEDFDYPRKLTWPQHHPSYPEAELSGMDFEEFNQDGHGFRADFIPGVANWLAEQDGNMANKVPWESDQDTIGPVDHDNDPETPNSYVYNVSLIGKYAPDPDLLERWSYYTELGDLLNAPDPSSWTEIQPVIIGSVIQLGNEFPPVGLVPTTANNRDCNQNSYKNFAIPFSDLDTQIGWNSDKDPHPCRATDNKSTPWDLLASNPQPAHEYDQDYLRREGLADPIYPPGEMLGLRSRVVEIAWTSDHWRNKYEPPT